MASELNIILGRHIRAARNRMGLTQEALAAQVGRTPESISNIERGQQLPSIETLADLARVLGVPVGEFFEGVGVSAPRRSAKRLELEARWREIGRALADRDLTVAVAQANVFLTQGS